MYNSSFVSLQNKSRKYFDRLILKWTASYIFPAQERCLLYGAPNRKLQMSPGDNNLYTVQF